MNPTPYLDSEPDVSSLARPSTGDTPAGVGLGGLLLDGNMGESDGLAEEGMLDEDGLAAISGVSATG